MNFKTILVHVDDGPTCPARIAIAAQLTHAFDAHLVGVVGMPAVELLGMVRAELGEELVRRYSDAHDARCRAAEEAFRSQAAAAGVDSLESRVLRGDIERSVATHTRYADLLIMGQPDPSAPGEGRSGHLLESALLTGGRPVLIVPYAGRFQTVGERVLVAWNASRESTRAVTDSIPLLERARAVTVLTANAEASECGHGDLPGSDIALYLARHGVRAEAAPTVARDIDVGDWLLSRAFDLEIDLIVMGAYGHSRLRELVLGGVTRSILRHMTVPVLMSH